MKTPIVIAVSLISGCVLSQWASQALAQPRENRERVGDGFENQEPVQSPRGIFRIWSPPSDSEVRHSDYKALLKDGAPLARAVVPGRDDPKRECTPGMPQAMFDPTPIEFVQNETGIILLVPAFQTERIIHIGDGQTSAAAPMPSPLGYSIGHWDHDVLVIETTHVDWPVFDVDEFFALRPSGVHRAICCKRG